MSEKPFTIESFYEFCKEKKLMAIKCRKCGKVFEPPRILCPKCNSRELEWIELKGEGKLITYTIIHVAPPRFAHLAPYAVGIVELDEGARLPGIIKVDSFKKLRVGMRVKVEFEDESESEEWPQWPRYYFKPVEN